MATVKYEMKVTAVGPLVAEFTVNGILVFFGEEAPEELREFSILHQHGDLKAPIVPGDKVLIGSMSYKVLAVGDVANENIINLGHVIIKTNGLTEPELPGDICVEKRILPPIHAGTKVQIVGV